LLLQNVEAYASIAVDIRMEDFCLERYLKKVDSLEPMYVGTSSRLTTIKKNMMNNFFDKQQNNKERDK
jgi:hypothetical protein